MDFKVAGTPRVRHRAAARHQARRHPVGRAGRRAAAGARRPADDPRRDGRGDRVAGRACREYAPRVTTVKIPVDKIGMVIGPKGQTINAIQDETGAEISIEDDGTIYVGATDGPSRPGGGGPDQRASPTRPCRRSATGSSARWSRRPRSARSSRCCPGRDGLLHISKVGDGKRVERVEDFLNVGDKVEVEIAEIDARGKIYLDKVRPRGRRGARRPAAATGRRPCRPAADRGDRGPRDRRRPRRPRRRATVAPARRARPTGGADRRRGRGERRRRDRGDR